MATVTFTVQEYFNAIGFLGGAARGIEIDLGRARAAGHSVFVITHMEKNLAECRALLAKLQGLGL